MPAAEPITVEMLERWLEEQIEETRKSRASPLPDPNLRADHVCYNITTQTCCWDFCCCLVDMEMTRVREGAPAPLKIGFVSGPQDPLKFHSTFQEMMFRKVRRPMLGLLGAVESNRAKYGRRVRVRGYGPVSAAARAGEPVPRFRSGLPLYTKPPTVTITLREVAYSEDRNSRLDDWLAFAKHLTARGEDVMFIRDTAKADEPIDGFKTAPRASKDLWRRMMFYERARCNFFVSNGPWNLGLFSNRPYATFINAHDGDLCNLPIAWRDHHGVPVGTQFPWASPQQRVFWKPDTYRNLCEAWEELGVA